MKRTSICLIGLAMMVPQGLQAEDTVTKLDTHRILELTGGKGQLDEKEGVFKVTDPRTDLSVVVEGVRVTPALGLTSWAAFKAIGDETMVMGDLVVLETQVSPVMDTALETGLDVTALHNHFLGDSPKVMFMHVGGTGDQKALANAVGAVFARIRDTAEGGGPVTKAKIDPAKTTLDPKKIEAILGVAGKLDAGVYKVVVARRAKMHGHPIGGSMGVNTWAAFAGSDDEAAVAGDFAMRADEVQPVLRVLRAANIHVVALHNHMTEESPRTFFLHYWGVGSTERLAKELRAALDLTSEERGAKDAERSRRQTIDFEGFADDVGPPGFTVDLTGEGRPGAWRIAEDQTAPAGSRVLARTSDDPTSGRFPLCVFEGFFGRDVDVSVSLKPVAGEVDQAGGILWRYRDRDNYYVVRANALEDNVVLYKVENGKRTDLKPVAAWPFAYGKKIEVPSGTWSELRVVAKGKTHSVYFDGQHLFDVEDETFSEPGRVGLWTKADSVTRFDALAIELLDETSRSEPRDE